MDISQKIQKLYEQTGISPEVHDFGEKIEKSLKERFDKIDKMAELNQLKVIHAMQEARVNAECLTMHLAMDTMILEEIRWKRCMQMSFIPKMRW